MDAISASKLPRAEVCPASFALPAQHEPGGRYADDGTAIHAQLHAAAHGKDAPAWLRAMYAELTEGATQIFAERCYAWSPETGTGRDLGTHERDYSGLRPGEIGGTVDLVVVRPNNIVVVDYKSGFFGGSVDSPQLSMLALAVRDAMQVGEVTVAIVTIDASAESYWTKHKTLDALDLAGETIRLRRIVRNVEKARGLVQIGRTPDVRLSDDGCRYCPCKAACPAKTGAIATVAAMAGLAKPEVSIPVTTENAGAVWLAIDAMEAVLAKAREQVKELARSGPVPLPDGRELWAVEETRESVSDVDAVAAVLAEKYGEDAVAEAIEVKRTVSKGALEAVAKKRADPKQGAKDAKALVDALREAGALKSSSYLKYTAKEKKAG